MGSCLSVHDDSDDGGCFTFAKRKQRKQRIMEILAAEAKNNELLFRMPGRMCRNGSISNACMFTQQGRKGTNQDAMIVWENFASSSDTTFCGVFDGHGPFGHLVAKKVRDSLPSKLSALYKAVEQQEIRMSSTGHDHGEAKELNASEEVKPLTLLEKGDINKVFATWRDCFLKSFHAMDKELKSHPAMDCFCSGTTAVTMVLQGQDMVIANVGDSRAVLATVAADDATKVEPFQLTVDLKPNLPLEAERIKRCKGRVFALEDEPEVARVWLPHDDSPGLAMARAFGDFCLKDFGLIAVPDVTYTKLTEKDQFVVLASDGIWDVLSNKEVVETIWDAPTRSTAARSLVETAVRAWRLKYPTSKVDDCAVVCFFLTKQRKWQAQANVSACSAVELEEDSIAGGVVGAKATPHEFSRSNTLRCGSDTNIDDSQLVVEESSIQEDNNGRDIGRDIVADDCALMEINNSIDAKQDGNNAIKGSDDEDDGMMLVGALPCDMNVKECVGATPKDNALNCSPVGMEPQHGNSFSCRDPERSELADTSPFVMHEEGSSEITVLSDLREDEVGNCTSASVLCSSSSRRSLAECLSLADEDEWSALEGVARVNSLMTLPRFLGADWKTGRGGSPWSSGAKSGKSKQGVNKKKAGAPAGVSKRRW